MRSLSEAADLSEKVATARATELQRLVEQLHAQIGELKQQLKSSHQRVELLDAARNSLDARVQEVQELARSERESLGQYVRSAEDRALAWVVGYVPPTTLDALKPFAANASFAWP